MRVRLVLLGLLLGCQPETGVERVQVATLPADTRAEGPDAGAAIAEVFARHGLERAGQPVQGFSAVLPDQDALLCLMDNGFGARDTSADMLLRWYRVRMAGDTVEILGHVGLSDPDAHIPWTLAREDRWLTGADFDPESFQRAPDGTFWIGDEFGPFLLHVDALGRLLEPPVAVPVPDAWRAFARGATILKSPQHPDLRDAPDAAARANIGPSKGFEGMALTPDGRHLLPMLEANLLDHPQRAQAPLLEFDLVAREFTGRHWAFPLDAEGHAIGAVQTLDANRLLVLERDPRAGRDATHKRVHRWDFTGSGQKHLVADLLQLRDPTGAPLRLSYVTLESLRIVDPRTLLIVNDNNYPFPGRFGPPDETTFSLLRLPEPIR